jgi:hypothetical protein
MTLQRRIRQLKRKASLNELQYIILINPDTAADATVFIVDIGGPKESYGLPPEAA